MATTEERLAGLVAASEDLDNANNLFVALKRAAQSGISAVKESRLAASKTLHTQEPEEGEQAAARLAQALQSIGEAVTAVQTAQQGEPGQRLQTVLANTPEPEPEPEEAPEPEVIEKAPEPSRE